MNGDRAHASLSMVEVTDKIGGRPPEWTGRHYWLIIAAYQVLNPARSQYYLDKEVLTLIEGPVCYHCQERWRPTIGARCPGEVPSEPS